MFKHKIYFYWMYVYMTIWFVSSLWSWTLNLRPNESLNHIYDYIEIVKLQQDPIYQNDFNSPMSKTEISVKRHVYQTSNI